MLRRYAPLLLALLASPVFAGSAGVSDGAIAGIVTDEGGNPVGGVFVVAQRAEQQPPLIRTTRSDAQGRYYLPVPTGGYTLGFSRQGFATRDTAQGDENNRTALGAQVRTFVEPGQTSFVQHVALRPIPSLSAAPTTVFLRDAITGDTVKQATVIVGSSVTSQAATDGRYVLQVPPDIDQDTGQARPLPVTVQADGFQPFTGQATVVGGGQPQQVSFQLQPLLVTLSGTVELDPTLPPEAVEQVQVIVRGVPPQFSQGRVEPSGYFEVMVPASSASADRRFDLSFALQGSSIATIPGVIAPRGGARSLGSAVRVNAVKTEVAGNVIASDGSLPLAGRITQAVIVELGRAVPLSGGSFSLSGVPVGRPLTLQVSVENPTTGAIEVGQTTFTAASGGGVFTVPPIITSPVAGP